MLNSTFPTVIEFPGSPVIVTICPSKNKYIETQMDPTTIPSMITVPIPAILMGKHGIF